MAFGVSAWRTVLLTTSMPRDMVSYLIVLSMAVFLILSPSSSAAVPLPQNFKATPDNGQRMLRMFSAKLYDQCLQMDTLACLGLKALYTTSRYLQKTGPDKVGDRGVLEKEDNVDEILTRNMLRYFNVSTDTMTVDNNAARGSFISKKMLFPLLVGITLKMGSLIPLILGKMGLLGIMSIMSSKLALVIMLMMNIKKWFGGSESSGGHHNVVPTLFSHPVHQSLSELGHSMSPFSHSGPQDMDDYNHGISHSGAGASPYRRRIFIVRSRQLGGDNFWNSDVDGLQDKQLQVDEGTDQESSLNPGLFNGTNATNTKTSIEKLITHTDLGITIPSEKIQKITLGNKIPAVEMNEYPESQIEFIPHDNEKTRDEYQNPIQRINKDSITSDSINTDEILASEGNNEGFLNESGLDLPPVEYHHNKEDLQTENMNVGDIKYVYKSSPNTNANTEDNQSSDNSLRPHNGEHIRGIRRLDEVEGVHVEV